MRTLRPALAASALALVLGCNGADYISIKPDTLVLRQKNNEIWLQGHAMSHTGVHYSRATIRWSVKDESIARVDATGKLTPVKSGRTEVVAETGNVKAIAPVEVIFAEKMTVSPNPVVLQEGGTPVELTVKVFDYQGRELKDRTPTFKALDREVVSMGQNAAFPVNAGATRIEVRVEELLQTVEVKVEPEGKRASRK